MKRFAHWLFGFIFHLYRCLPVKPDKAVFFQIHSRHFQGNLRCIYDALHTCRPGFKLVAVSDNPHSFSFWFRTSYHLATASYLFLNDNFLPLRYMNISPKTRVIQLWHGVGALKRFGLPVETDTYAKACVLRGNQRLTHLFVSSQQVIPFYSEAFGIDASKIHATGCPVTDFYFKPKAVNAAAAAFFSCYPELAGKKLLLYTPTFRRTIQENKTLLHMFDVPSILKTLGPGWAVLFRLHPCFPINPDLSGTDCIDVTDYPDIRHLYAAASVLVNDYSSTMVEFALLQKPIILYAYDLNQYDRGFYRDYRSTAPGPVAETMEELTDCLSHISYEPGQNRSFLALHYDYFDSGSTDRVLHELLPDSFPLAGKEPS